MLHRFFAFLVSGLCLLSSGFSQPYTPSQTNVNIAVVSGMNHLPMSVPVTYTADYDFTKLTVSSDSSWVAPALDGTTGALVLTYQTDGLINPTDTATVTLTDGTNPVAISVQATVSNLNLVALKADPTRSRVYGLQQDGSNAGSVVIYDSATGSYLGTLTVGNKPTDLAVKSDGSELLVICGAGGTVSVIDLRKLTTSQTITLSPYADAATAYVRTIARIAYGPAQTFYYVDGDWVPALRVWDRAQGKVIQTLLTSEAENSNGFGAIAVSSDQTHLLSWGQNGWTQENLSPSTAAVCYIIGPDGQLSAPQSSNVPFHPSDMENEPLDPPALFSADGTVAITKRFVFDGANLSTLRRQLPAPVYSITPNAEVGFTPTAGYQLSTGIKVFDLPVTSTVQTVTFDYSKLVYYAPNTHSIASIDLVAQLGNVVLGLDRTPAEGSIIQPPASLQWAPIPGINKYQIYLGDSSTVVAAAATDSAEYLGETTTSSIALSQTLVAGQTYYWRVDAVSPNATTVGGIFSFTVSNIAMDVSTIKAATVQAQSNYAVPINLTSATAGLSWSVASTSPWIRFSSSSGTTPATLIVSLDATLTGVGANFGTIEIKADDGTFPIPVSLQVDALELTIMRSRPNSTKVYAISEDTTATPDRAYLLEIDTLAQAVTRVVSVGDSVTDFAIHHADNRIYVTNWQGGSLLAVNLETFEVEQTYGFMVPQPTNFGGDVYRVSAGPAGRIFIEEENQWIQVSLFDTANSEILSQSFQHQGGGGSDATGRYYYHGDNNSSGAALHKFDSVGDQLTEMATAQIVGLGYGSRTVVISEDSSRIFWNGGVFDSSLDVLWTPGKEIYATSADGHYAFASDTIYDIVKKSVIGAMPVTTTVCAYNTATNRLVVQNGQQIAFYDPLGLSPLGVAQSPLNGAIIPAPSQLTWSELPGVTGYQVYLGTSATAVTSATTSSGEYQGQVATPGFSIDSSLTVGTTYYWRIDFITPGGTIAGDAQSFTVSDVTPSIIEIDAVTVQGDGGYPISIGLTSVTAGVAWTASSPDAWVKFESASGTTPNTLHVKLDASALAAGIQQSTITIISAGGTMTIPVKLLVDPLAITMMKTNPQSAKVYAISEQAMVAGIATRAYLVEIDSAQEKITRVAPAGYSVTDFAISTAENRIYVTNWWLGALLAFDRATFTMVRNYSFVPVTNYTSTDAYRVAADGAGRVVVEGANQRNDLMLYDTVNAKVIATQARLERGKRGGGAYSPDGRYYYHGGGESIGLIKYDTTGDELTMLTSASVNGDGFVAVTDDGQHVFYGDTQLASDLTTEWTIGDEIHAISSDGKYAFSSTKIYDTTLKMAVLAMPSSSTILAFNSQTSKLVMPVASGLGFYSITSPIMIPVPVLSVDNLNGGSVHIYWVVKGLQSSFTLQKRVAGTSDWSNVNNAITGTTRDCTLSDLVPATTYEFRIKGDSALVSSDWSTTISVAIPAKPEVTLVAWPFHVGTGNSTSLTATATGTAPFTYQWQIESYPFGGTWNDLTDDANYSDSTTATLTIANVTSIMLSYNYRCVATNGGGSTSSTAASISVDYNGTYFGKFGRNHGRWALCVKPGRAAVFIAYLADSHTVLIEPAFVLKNGMFSVDGTDFSVWGEISPSGDLLGQMEGRVTDTTVGSIDSEGNSPDGWYIAPIIGTAGGTVSMIVGPSGRALLVTVGSNPADSAYGTVDSAGHLTATTANGAQLSASIAAGSSSISCTLTDPATQTTTHFAGLADGVASTTRLVNVSVRSNAGTGAQTLIVGFVVRGRGTRSVLMRSVGPTLQAFHVDNPLANPKQELFKFDNGLQSFVYDDENDDWGGTSLLQETFSRLGAYALPAQSKDAALLKTLASGPYTVQVSSVDGGSSGIALVEAYDAETGTETRLMNVSARSEVGTGADILIGGFVVEGNTPKRVLIRAVGPSLPSIVTGVLADPQLTLVRHEGNPDNPVEIAVNDNWGGTQELKDVGHSVGAQALGADDSKDAAILITLAPGMYTAQVSGVDNTTGVALVEVYDCDGL